MSIRIERDLAYLLSLSFSLSRLLLYSTCRGIHRDRESAISQTGDQGCPVSSSPLYAWKSYSSYPGKSKSFILRDSIRWRSKMNRKWWWCMREGGSVMQETSFSTFRISKFEKKGDLSLKEFAERIRERKKEIRERGGNISQRTTGNVNTITCYIERSWIVDSDQWWWFRRDTNKRWLRY